MTRSRTVPDLAGHCPQCFLRTKYCICSEVPRIETETNYIILRHNKEIMKSSNTGRIASLALTKYELLDYGGRDQVFDPNILQREDIWLLFPKQYDGKKLEDHAEYPTSPPKHLIVLDGTWRQARRMVNRIEILRKIPKLMLPTPQTFPERLRKAPHLWTLSTIETIARSIELFEDREKAELLDKLFALFVKNFKEQRGWNQRLPSFLTY